MSKNCVIYTKPMPGLFCLCSCDKRPLLPKSNYETSFTHKLVNPVHCASHSQQMKFVHGQNQSNK
jgi:hypothetical protein